MIALPAGPSDNLSARCVLQALQQQVYTHRGSVFAVHIESRVAVGWHKRNTQDSGADSVIPRTAAARTADIRGWFVERRKDAPPRTLPLARTITNIKKADEGTKVIGTWGTTAYEQTIITNATALARVITSIKKSG